MTDILIGRLATNGEMARFMGLSERAVAARRVDGRLPCVDGRIDVRAVLRAGMDALARVQRGESEADGDLAQQLLAEKVRRERAQAEKAEMEVARIKADLIPADAVALEWQDLVRSARGAMLSIPARLRRDGVGAEALQMVDAEIRSALVQLADDVAGDASASA